MKNTTVQQAAPASKGTQTVSRPWPRLNAIKTSQSAFAAPMQTGSSATAMMNLTHFGTPQEFKIQDSEARNKAADV